MNLIRSLSLYFLLIISATISSCASQTEPVNKNPFFDDWKAKAENSQPYLPSREEFEQTAPGKLLQQELSVKSRENEARNKEEKKVINLPKELISVRFIDDDLATSLRTMARLADQNILISPSVKGTLNMHIAQTPWDVVFMGIVNSFGLTVNQEENLLHILSLDDLKQQVERKATLLEEEQVSQLITQIVPIEFSAPETIFPSVELLLSKNKEGVARGSVSVDSHSRSLVVRDTEGNISKILKLIYELDSPTPQILIKAHIVEATKDTARELGVKWGALSTNVLNDSNIQLTPGANASYSGGNLSYPSTSATSLDYGIDMGANTINSIAAASMGLIINGSDILLDAQLSALQSDGKLNILSSPSIATLDNSEAIIESGKDIPFQTTVDGSIIIVYKEATLKLTVTPHVISEKMVKLSIEAKKDEVDTDNTVNGNPHIFKKLAKTQLVVRNGDTVVLAGLSKEKHSDRDTGVPGLKDIPFLGHLFKQDSKSKEFEELLIFITPTILSQHAGVE
nr:type IV pilus secretin PilQ [Desulfobulbaceae bacterium]